MFTPDPPSKGPRAGISPVSPEDYITLTYRRLAGGSGTTGVDYTAGGYTYTVEVSTDLMSSSWLSGVSHVVAVGSPIANGDGTETVTVRTVAPLGASPRFMRLSVTESP